MSDTIKYFLEESKMPKSWYNIAADLPKPLDPVLHPGTLKPIGLRVPGCKTGSKGLGRSAAILYQDLGILLSSRKYFIVSDIFYNLNFEDKIYKLQE